MIHVLLPNKFEYYTFLLSPPFVGNSHFYINTSDILANVITRKSKQLPTCKCKRIRHSISILFDKTCKTEKNSRRKYESQMCMGVKMPDSKITKVQNLENKESATASFLQVAFKQYPHKF